MSQNDTLVVEHFIHDLKFRIFTFTKITGKYFINIQKSRLLQYLRNEAVAVFASLINHNKIGDDEIFNECICRVIISTPNLLEKVGYPSQNNHETCRFSQHDYDDDNDFSHVFTREIQFDQ